MADQKAQQLFEGGQVYVCPHLIADVKLRGRVQVYGGDPHADDMVAKVSNFMDEDTVTHVLCDTCARRDATFELIVWGTTDGRAAKAGQ